MEHAATIVSNEQHLRDLTDSGTFERGRAYWQAGHVGSPRGDGKAVIATVAGSRDYHVRLWREDGDLAWSCTCPVGDTGAFCKHAVALGLAVLAGAGGAGRDAPPTIDDIRAWLLGKNTAELVEMILTQARDDDRLLQRLSLGVVRERGAGIDPGVWRRALDDAIGHRGFVEYAEAHAYVAGIEDVLDNLDGLLADGHAGTVIALADHAIDALAEALNEVDDSNGEVAGQLHRLKALHLAACHRAAPAPEELAPHLFERELDDEWGVFSGTAAAYADVLGETGLAAFQRLAEAEWSKIPALKPGDSDSGRYGRRYRIRAIMLALAADLDAEVAVMERDLSTPYAFLEISQRCKSLDRPDAALDWAERGWSAFADQRPDERLRAFLADAWHERGRHDEAMALVWDGFAATPGFILYQTLKAHADRCDQWPDWRAKALARIREHIAAAGGSAAPPLSHPWPMARRGHSELVDIFLWEGDDEAAWQEACAGGCTHQHWLLLAERHAATHPEDALAVYRDQLPVVLPVTGSGDYERAMGFLRRIRDLLAVLGRGDAFLRFIADLRTQHRRKRNFIALLNREGW